MGKSVLNIFSRLVHPSEHQGSGGAQVAQASLACLIRNNDVLLSLLPPSKVCRAEEQALIEAIANWARAAHGAEKQALL